MPSLTRSMFGVTGMNVVKVEKTRPCLRSGCLRSGRVQSICSRLKDQWRRYAVLKDLKQCISSISSTSYNCLDMPKLQFGRKTTKNENSKFWSQLLSGSAGRVYDLQYRSSCRMRNLHYPTLGNTRSIEKLRTNMYILLNDQSSWRISKTTANDICYSRFNILSINFISVSQAFWTTVLIHRLGSP